MPSLVHSAAPPAVFVRFPDSPFDLCQPYPPARDDGRVESPAPVHVLNKFIVVVDVDVNVRDWKEVAWAARWGWTPPTNGSARHSASEG